MKCPQCGYHAPRGRPKQLDDDKVRRLRAKGKTLREIASELGVTHGAVSKSLKRKA